MSEKSVNDSFFFVIILIGAGIIIFPLIQSSLPALSPEEYTELYLLGSSHEADNYPFTIVEDESYGVYVNVINNRGELTYYQVQIKIRSYSDEAPNAILNKPSPQDSIYAFSSILTDESNWEKAVAFSIPIIYESDELLFIPNIIINDVNIKVDKTILWEENKGYFLGIIFELWRYDDASEEFQFDNRFNEIWLNVTTN